MTERSGIEFLPTESGRPFSAGVRVGDVLYLSGQIGTLEDGSLADGFAAQSRRTMENIATALHAAGADLTDVFKATVMLENMARWDEFNAIYLEFFAADRLPARSAFGTSGLALGAHLEVECWAYLPVPRK